MLILNINWNTYGVRCTSRIPRPITSHTTSLTQDRQTVYKLRNVQTKRMQGKHINNNNVKDHQLFIIQYLFDIFTSRYWQPVSTIIFWLGNSKQSINNVIRFIFFFFLHFTERILMRPSMCISIVFFFDKIDNQPFAHTRKELENKSHEICIYSLCWLLNVQVFVIRRRRRE